jgi:thymidylate synthase
MMIAQVCDLEAGLSILLATHTFTTTIWNNLLQLSRENQNHSLKNDFEPNHKRYISIDFDDFTLEDTSQP